LVNFYFEKKKKMDEEKFQVLFKENETISNKMKILWEIRVLEDKKVAVEILETALEKNFNSSVLLRHEICYVLGQISHNSANKILYKILSNLKEDCMVRHEGKIFNSNKKK
jgi:hypothetical protein